VYRFGVDIGGTFTDLVIQDAASGLIQTLKVPSTPADPSEAVLNAIRQAADGSRITSIACLPRSRPAASQRRFS
jgi:N-methylhydantoinase A